MEQFIVSARKYRPQTFEDVVGQEAITNTLSNAIANNHLAQALLFTGPRGVGKTTCARILAKKINQQASGEFSEDQDFAFNVFELDAASNNGVDDIRELIDQVRIPPQTGKYKVYIIDEVHMLSSSAFNAFLKTLEEPPKHVIFILATTEKHKIIPTILSRCQIFDFKRITVSDAKNYLAKIAEKEGVEAEDDALHIIAQKADGAMRDALSIYDRVVSYSGKHLTREAVAENLNVLDYDVFFKSTDLILNNDIPGLLIQFNETLAKGFDGQHYIAGLASHFRDLLVCQNQETISLLEVGEDAKRKYFDQSKACSKSFLLKGIDLANSCDFNYSRSHNQRLHVELCLMQLASLTFESKKKKPDSGIISPEESKTISTKAEPVQTPSQDSEISAFKEEKPSFETSKSSSKSTEHSKEEKISQSEPSKPEIKTGLPKAVSGLSLKSITAKKKHRAKKLSRKENAEVEIAESFTEEQLIKVWKKYIKRLNKNGQKILASNLAADRPKVEGTIIRLELPNQTMKREIELEQGSLMSYLKEKLRNTRLSLEIDVNEEVSKKYAFTPIEKFNRLKEKNPLVEKLKDTFDLDI